MRFASKASEINCEVCARCKIHVQPFKSSTTREKEPLSLVHLDICGPINVESAGGARYFVTFIDDYSRYTITVMLRNRSDVIQAFKDYKQKMENLTNRRIKKLRTNNDKEYVFKEFSDFLKQEDITCQLSVKYTPQQNGVAERANRTLVEMARCIMLQANFPKSMWAEAVNAATYLRNRCATKSLNGMTPFEAWSRKKPYVGFLRTIGSKVIMLNKGQSRGKFQPKGDEYILVGYSEESKAYRLWKPGTKKAIKARDVKFFEDIDCVHDLSNGTCDMLCLTIDTPCDECDDSLSEEDENATDKSDTESNDPEETINRETSQTRNRGRSRPTLLKTGKPGRPRKIYQSKGSSYPDPRCASEISERVDKES